MINKFWIGFQESNSSFIYGITGTVRMDCHAIIFREISSGVCETICSFLIYVVPGTVYSSCPVGIRFHSGEYLVRLRNPMLNFDKTYQFTYGLAKIES